MAWFVPTSQTAQAEGRGTRADPYWTGTSFTSADWRLSLGKTDPDAWPKVKKENQFNEAPAKGWRYVMVAVTTKYEGRQTGLPWLDVDVEFVGGDGRVYTEWCGVLPDSLLDVDELYRGAKATGNWCAAVPASAIKGGQWRVAGDWDAPWRFVRQSNPSKPSIKTQPTSVTVFADSSVTFKATVSGAKSTRWQQKIGGSWRDIKGATSTSHKVKASPSLNGQQFRLAAKNTTGTTYSKTAKLTVKTKPDITAQPKSVGLSEGSTAKFSVKTDGATKWRWQQQSGSTWKNISKATGKSYSVKATTVMNGRKYRVVASTKYGSTTSKTATLTVEAKPVIATQPKSAEVAEGTTATLSVKTTGATKWQWQQLSGSTWKNISKAMGQTYSVKATTKLDGQEYRVVASAKYGSTASKRATLTVVPKPAISTQPRSATVAEGKDATLSVKTTGATKWQWQQLSGSTWKNIAGATGTSYTVKATPALSGTQYRVQATGRYASATSNSATLTVVALPVISTQPKSITVQPGHEASYQLRVKAANAETLQWQEFRSGSWQDVHGATESVLDVRDDTDGRIRVVASNAAGSVISSEATVRAVGTKARPIGPDETFKFVDGSAVFFPTDPDATLARSLKTDGEMDVRPGYRLVEVEAFVADTPSAVTLTLVARNGAEYIYDPHDWDRRSQCGLADDDADYRPWTGRSVWYCLPVDDNVDLSGAVWRVSGWSGDVWVKTGL